MSRVTDHTRTEKIGGDSVMFVVIQVVAGNRYDNSHQQSSHQNMKNKFDFGIHIITLTSHQQISLTLGLIAH